MNSSSPQRIPLKKALFAIVLSTILVSGSSFLGFIYYKHLKDSRRHDPQNTIIAIVQTTSGPERIKTSYFAELLDLSLDHPINLYDFNSQEALQKLLAAPLIKEAKVTKVHPGTLWVDYTLRKPIAVLGDYSNTMIDREGIPFPIQPFFTPKRIPEIVLGRLDEESSDDGNAEKEFSWGAVIRGKRLKLAFALLDFMSEHYSDPTARLERIDVSHAFAPSYGQRQIVLVVACCSEKKENGKPMFCVCQRLLRLSTDNYEQQLHRYFLLNDYLSRQEPSIVSPKNSNFKSNSIVIDLRISDLAFISLF